MAAVITIIRKFAAKIQKSMRGAESMGQIFFIFYMKLTYNDATKTHFQIFKKSNMAAVMAIIIDDLELKY